MEVHHHSHTARKKWTHYFWEFLMLFLAVFCGFLAEYQLEHKIEKDREKQYMESYIEDLQTDTTNANRIISGIEKRQTQLDSFMLLLKSHQYKGFENTLYYFGRTLIRTFQFRNNSRTISQLLSSGSLRLIRNKQAADSIMNYKDLIERLDGSQEDELLERRDCKPLLEKIYDPFVFDAMVDSRGIHRIENNPPLRSYDPELLKELAHKIHQIKGSNVLILNRLKNVEKMATNLIVLLKKEYHLK